MRFDIWAEMSKKARLNGSRDDAYANLPTQGIAVFSTYWSNFNFSTQNLDFVFCFILKIGAVNNFPKI